MVSASSQVAMFALPALVLCGAVVLALWARHRALAAPIEARASVWFWCVRFLRNLNLGTITLWWFFTDLFHLKPYAASLWQDRGLSVLPASHTLFLLLFWTPPITVLIFCQVLFQPVYAQVRGFDWTRSDLARQAAYSLGVWLVPALCFVSAFRGIEGGDAFPTFAFSGALGIVCLTVSARALRKQFFLTPYALTTGELRDRAFALAARLGVQLRQIYLLPPGKSRFANAFARSGNSILLTEILLSHLNKREVDGVIAHELSHLKHDHPRLLGFALMGGTIAVAVPYLSWFWSPAWLPYFDLLFVSVPLLTYYFFARRFEYTADATAAKLTGDPAACISGLVKLHHLNLMPLEWSKWSEKGLTHPSTVRRARAIGRVSGMSEQRIDELLAEPADDKSSGEPGDFYACPAPSKAAAKIFSTQFKQRIALRTFFFYVACAALAPAVLLRGFDRFGWPPSSFLAFVLVLAICFPAALLLSNFLPFTSNFGLCRRLRAKFAARKIPSAPPDGILVGFSPGDSPRIFESNYTWDTGAVVFTADRLCYFGEETQFALHRDQIISVRLGEGFPGWFRTNFLYITVGNARDSSSFVFNLRPIETASALHLKRAVRDLERRVNDLRNGSGLFPDRLAEAESLGPPQIGAVTSTSTAEAWKPRQAFSMTIFLCFISGLVAAWLKLPLEWLAPMFSADAPQGTYARTSGWYAVFATALVTLFLFGPFWFARSPKLSPAQPVPPPPLPVRHPDQD